MILERYSKKRAALFAGFRGFYAALFVAALGPLALSGATAQSSQQLSARSLNVAGFNYETELTALFLGDFGKARMQPDELRFLALLNGYIGAYSQQCPSFLPKDRIEITESRCVEQTVMRNGWGVQVGSATCSRYQNFGTGRYGDPQLMRLSARLAASLTPGLLGSSLGLNGGDPMASSRQMMDTALAMGNDMPNLLERNGCASPAVKRLQANIVRFATRQPALRLASGATLATLRAPAGAGAAFRDSDYARLVDALIAENAQGWMLNRYVSGSASDVSVESRDGAGRPAQLTARYQFGSFGGQEAGTVSVTFSDGLPECLYFFDAPQTCRLPSRRVITAYEKGEYRR